MTSNITHAWKETAVQTTEEHVQLPETPSEVLELTDTDLENVSGAFGGWGWDFPPVYGYGYGYGHGYGGGYGLGGGYGHGGGYGYGYGHGS